MAVSDLVTLLKKAIDIRTYAQSTGGNYLRNPIAAIDARWEGQPFIRIDTTGNTGIQRSRAVEVNLPFGTIDQLFDLKLAYIDDLHADIRKEARVLLDPAIDGFALEYAKRRLRQALDRADKLYPEDEKD